MIVRLSLIAIDRFLVRSSDRDAWHSVRSGGVSATRASRIATPAGFKKELVSPDDDWGGNAYTQWGSDTEAAIAGLVKNELGLMPNDWLIASEWDPTWFATPDMLSLDHRRIGEIKTTGKDFKTIPKDYMRQIQWQLLVTGAEECVFIWMLRAGDKRDGFYPAWIDPKVRLVERDEEMIEELAEKAREFQDQFGLAA